MTTGSSHSHDTANGNVADNVEQTFALEINLTGTFDSEASRMAASEGHEEGSESLPDQTRELQTTTTTTTTPTEENKKRRYLFSMLKAATEGLRYLYSTILLSFSVFLVMAAIFTEQTVGTSTTDIGVHPVLAFFIFWFLIGWLAMMEGGQGCLVGLNPIDKESYRETHPKTWKNTSLAHNGDNMERFIVGRQFLVVLVVFVSSMMSSPVPDVDILGLPEGLQSVFLESGVAIMLITITIGQLAAQVNAANCMLDFVNNYFVLYFVTYASLAIEFSGLLHCVYLVQVVFAKISGNPVESNEQPRSHVQQAFFWGRVLLSLAILAFAFAVTISALFAGTTTMWDGVPAGVSVIALFVLMFFSGLMEGMQIALFAVVNLPEEELAKQMNPIAHKNFQLAFKGKNLQAFLIGRQILVTVCMFVVARISTLDIEVGVDENIFGVSDGLQNFFNTGLLGAVITTIVASLAWRVIASSSPVPFLSNPLIYLIIRLCLILEASGLCSAAWLLASVQRKVAGLQPDEVYIGKSEESQTSSTRKTADIEEQSAGAKSAADTEQSTDIVLSVPCH
jgi:hypothetical protein